MTDGETAIYCKRCAAEVGESDAFCATCGTELDGLAHPEAPADAPSRWWWLGILVHPVTAFLAFLVGFAAGFTEGVGDPAVGSAIATLSGGVEFLGILSGFFLAPLAVYFDGRHLAARRSGWTPTRWYYLALVPYLGILFSLVYVVRRRRALP